MQSEEIEAWYQREKERITDEFVAKLKATGNKDIVKVHAEFEPKYKALIAKYNSLHNKTIDQEELQKNIEKKKKLLRELFEGMKKKVHKE